MSSSILELNNDFKSGNWDPLHGMAGLGIYFLERNKETGEKKFLEKIVDHLAKMRTTVDEYKVWITPGYENTATTIIISEWHMACLVFFLFLHRCIQEE